MKSVYISLFIFSTQILFSGAHYNKAFIDELCNENNVGIWNLGSGNPNSSGILETSKTRHFLPDKNCSVLIQPPLGYGITLSVRLIDFRPFYPGDCQSYVEISDELKTVKLCGYSEDLSEYQSYFSEEKPLKLNFVTVKDTGPQYKSNVFFVVTSYVKFSYSCEMKMFRCENSRCIWKGLTCDGHNNCGDQSDEFSSRNSNCGSLAPGIIAGIVVGSVMGFIAFIITLYACCRCCLKSENSERDPPLIDPDPRYSRNVERESVQRVDVSHPSSSSYMRDLPPAYKP